jgi:hypothetical protein
VREQQADAQDAQDHRHQGPAFPAELRQVDRKGEDAHGQERQAQYVAHELAQEVAEGGVGPGGFLRANHRLGEVEEGAAGDGGPRNQQPGEGQRQ